MTKKQEIQLFEERKVRTVWDSEQEEWYFSIVDVCGILTEQQGKEKAGYGTYLIAGLAKVLEPEYGSGFSKRQLELSRQFYRVYPIANAARSQFNWTQYRTLIQIADADKREYYELEAANNGKIVLVKATDKSDPGASAYTIKKYSSEKVSGKDGDSWHHTRITLSPLNPGFRPIVLTAEEADDGEFKVYGELIKVIGKNEYGRQNEN